MKDLSAIRTEIDAVDRALAPLVVRRLQLADDVAAAKRAAGVPVTDASREKAILDRVAGTLPPDFADEVRQVYAALFAVSKQRQRQAGLASAAAPRSGEA